MPDPPDVEIVRLPVPRGGERAVLDLCADDPYFRQEGLTSRRLLRDTAEPAVVLLLEWRSRADADRAIRTPAGRRFLARLAPLLDGAPQILHVAEA